jgi:hypothetical protein
MSVDLKRTLKKPSEISYNYATIKITQSRIDKGLLAIPIGLAESFPRQNKDVEVYLNDSLYLYQNVILLTIVLLVSVELVV